MGYTERIRAVHRELGIPPDYATTRGLALQVEGTLLVMAGHTPDGRELRLTPETWAAWQQLRTAAAGEGVSLLLLSGFRGVDRQTEIIRRKLGAGQPINDILQVNAAPGYSEHHTGRAVDIGTSDIPPLEESFADTAAFRWLETHAHQFGFLLSYPRDNAHGIAFEPWHWCWQNAAGR
jgi:D-alanyl-D-alanine carboxypeptidase